MNTKISEINLIFFICCKLINIDTINRAINGGSDQIIEYCQSSAGLNAMNAVAVTAIDFLTSAICKSWCAPNTNTAAQKLLSICTVRFTLSPSKSPKPMTIDNPGGLTVIGMPVASRRPFPLAKFLPTAT